MGIRKVLEKKFRDKVQKKEHKQVKAKIPRGARVKDGMLMVPDSFTKSGKIRGGKILSSLKPRKGFKTTPKVGSTKQRPKIKKPAGPPSKTNRFGKMGGGMMKKRMKRGGSAK